MKVYYKKAFKKLLVKLDVYPDSFFKHFKALKDGGGDIHKPKSGGEYRSKVVGSLHLATQNPVRNSFWARMVREGKLKSEDSIWGYVIMENWTRRFVFHIKKEKDNYRINILPTGWNLINGKEVV